MLLKMIRLNEKIGKEEKMGKKKKKSVFERKIKVK